MKTERVWINDQLICNKCNISKLNTIHLHIFQYSSTEINGLVMRFNGEDMQCTYFSLECRLLHVYGNNENFTIDKCQLLTNA